MGIFHNNQPARQRGKLARIIRWICAILLIAVLVTVVPPVCFLATVWWRDIDVPLAMATTGSGDASRLAAAVPAEVIAISPDEDAALRQLLELVTRASHEGRKISISGARHSMGGHTLYPGGITLDMLPFKKMALDVERRILTVGAGARWAEVISYLDRQGMAVGVMQSNNDFSVGGSLSLNCHGWQPASPPMASTVEAFRLVTARGEVIRCSRTENAELFSLVLGGNGLFGVILEAELRVVPNEFYVAKSHRVSLGDYIRRYRELTNRTDVGMAYGRISTAPSAFLQGAAITVLTRKSSDLPVKNTLSARQPHYLMRLVFRGTVGSDYGKNLRWRLEGFFGGSGGLTLSRNETMNVSAAWFSNRDPQATEILHEYFVPPDQLETFVDRARRTLSKHRPDLLNITVREVRQDNDTFLRFAREDVFALVMLFNQTKTPEAEQLMRRCTKDLIEDVLACGGTYYLPYRPHATREQFARAYPQGAKFFELKHRYDPEHVFENMFSLNYDPRHAPAK